MYVVFGAGIAGFILWLIYILANYINDSLTYRIDKKSREYYEYLSWKNKNK